MYLSHAGENRREGIRTPNLPESYYTPTGT